jgi:hypothetical protein
MLTGHNVHWPPPPFKLQMQEAATALADATLRAESAEARAAAFEAAAEKLSSQVGALEERVGRGEFNPATTRVLHLRRNPESEARAKEEAAHRAHLESENAALRQNLQRMEAAAAGSSDGAGAARGGVHVAELEGEVALLQGRLAESQKAADRLQSVFSRQITMFRDAMYLLFGYRVEMTVAPGAKEMHATFVLTPQVWVAVLTSRETPPSRHTKKINHAQTTATPAYTALPPHHIHALCCSTQTKLKHGLSSAWGGMAAWSWCPTATLQGPWPARCKHS